MMQNRFLSPVVWGAITAQALTILVTAGVIDTGLSEGIKNVIAGILQLLVLAGVLNNPTSGESF